MRVATISSITATTAARSGIPASLACWVTRYSNSLSARTPATRLRRLLGGDFFQVGFIRRNALTSLARIDRHTPNLESALATADTDWDRADQARLYLGSSLLLDGRADAAEPVLEVAVSSPLPPVRERAAWQLVQARLVLGDADGARSTLEGLTSSPVFGTRAAELLQELDSSQ